MGRKHYSILTILPTVSLDLFHYTIPVGMRINPLRAAHFTSKTRCNMCCFPSYNNIGFQPQVLKKAGVGFASSAEAIHGVAVPRRGPGF
jgi:hypothetical protein